jgi:excisionase family DNA binding protein
MESDGKLMKVGNGSIDIGKDVLTTEEAAERVGVSTRTMRRLVAQRRIRHWRLGRLVRLQAGDVDSFLSRCTVEPVE